MMQDPLGFGHHIVIDGFGAERSSLEGEVTVRSLVARLAKLIEPDGAHEPLLVHPSHDPVGGLTAGAAFAEGHLSIHTFAAWRLCSLAVFARRDLPPAMLFAELAESLGAGRFESAMGSRSKNLPGDPEVLSRVWLGERRYTLARLDLALLEP
jgi:S-adenosylmethionine/arginine decarboxylase-like enzyme